MTDYSLAYNSGGTEFFTTAGLSLGAGDQLVVPLLGTAVKSLR